VLVGLSDWQFYCALPVPSFVTDGTPTSSLKTAPHVQIGDPREIEAVETNARLLEPNPLARRLAREFFELDLTIAGETVLSSMRICPSVT
jgi:hypothetical protein